MSAIDLNADLGESIGDDAAMLEVVTQASIACGGHAGNAETMRRAIRMAREQGVSIGAHPGFADPDHFGRRRLDLPRRIVIEHITAQVETLAEIAAGEGVRIDYVKLHGALANMAAEDFTLAADIFGAIAERFPGFAVLAIEASAQADAAEALGLKVILEAYADRAYDGPGRLTSRSTPGSVLTDPETVVERCLRLAQRGELVDINGRPFASRARSICVHGDTPGALQLATSLAQALKNRGFLARQSPDN